MPFSVKATKMISRPPSLHNPTSSSVYHAVKLTLSETPSLPRCRRTSTPDRGLSNRNLSENKVPEPTTGVRSKKTVPTESKQTMMPPMSKKSLPWKSEMITSLLLPVESSLMTLSSTLPLPTGMWRVTRVSLIVPAIV